MTRFGLLLILSLLCGITVAQHTICSVVPAHDGKVPTMGQLTP